MKMNINELDACAARSAHSVTIIPCMLGKSLLDMKGSILPANKTAVVHVHLSDSCHNLGMKVVHLRLAWVVSLFHCTFKLHCNTSYQELSDIATC